MMRLPKFEYHAPRKIADAVKLMAEAGAEGQFVAGGTDLYPNMKRRQQTPKVVIGLQRIAALKKITGAPSTTGVSVGAAVTLTELIENRTIQKYYPVIAHAARLISTPVLQIWEPSAAICSSIRAAITMTRITNGAKEFTSA